ncbi:alpha-tubulin suppressor-like RCC1 family protein [Nocardioides sp. J9]|uniref:RCC1 domain-containing protein n=1 Tax=Nocardioides sp. J9 TaxID=935844 RepID=UPI0011AD9342|nr:hypothetical protein [Nocardioides sp. J9]TWG97246.1 alpha-tubulin suppressor-like RCC1 family protein [Nocardioides sp. J9]
MLTRTFAALVATLLGATLAVAVPATAVAPAPTGDRAGSGTGPGVVPARAARGLRVVVSRPAAAASQVRVTVTGPRQGGKAFRKVVRRTTTWANVKPGRYRVTARTIRLHDQRVVPRVSRTTVVVPRNRARRSATVTYRAPSFCARTGSRLHAWGDNSQGQLGTASGGYSTRPVANRWLRGAKAVVGTRLSTHALCADGTVWSWGHNGQGQLGVGDTKRRHWPVRVPGLTGVTALAAGTDAVYALRRDGSVWAWGSGRYGQLGNDRAGFGYFSARPVRVQSGPMAVKQVVAGGYTAYALTESGAVLVWGNGETGQRGNGTHGVTTPVPVVASAAGLAPGKEIAAGWCTLYVLNHGAEAYAWGCNNQGEIPGLAAASTSSPRLFAGAVSHVRAGRSAGFHNVGGAWQSWGSGRHHDTGRDTGGTVSGIGNIPTLPIGAGFASAGYGGVALSGGQVYAWGDHGRGQVGDGTPATGPSATAGRLPVALPGLTSASAVGAGGLNGYAIVH